MIMGVQGTTLSNYEKRFIVENNIGGVILFGRNLQEPKQIYELTRQIQSLSAQQEEKLPLFIGIDMEGGRVHRLKPPFTHWPALQKIGKMDSTSLSFKFAQCMGRELASIGVNLNFAPCIDVLTNSKNTVIGDRSISSDAEVVTKHSSALVRGYIKSGIIPCAKHFPGHGNTLVDSHEDLPVETTTSEALHARELIPFKKAFRARLDMVMTSHIQFKNIDPDYPVTFSKKFLSEWIRDEFRFRNIIISDDLDMKALTKYFSREEIPVKALQAGVDILLYCNEPESPEIAVDSVCKALAEDRLNRNGVEESYRRVIKLKKEKLTKLHVPTLEEMVNIIGHPDHMRLAKAIEAEELPEDLLVT